MQAPGDEQQVAEWLRSLGLGKYGDLFIAHAIRSDVLPLLDHDDLEEIGVASTGHRIRILQARQPFQQPSVDVEPRSTEIAALHTKIEHIERQLRKYTDTYFNWLGRLKENEPLPTPHSGEIPARSIRPKLGSTIHEIRETGFQQGTFFSSHEPFKTFKLGKEDTTARVASIVHRKYGLEGQASDYRLVVQYIDEQGQMQRYELQDSERVQQVCGGLKDRGCEPVLSLIPLE